MPKEEITITELEAYRGLSAELEALQKERQWIYYPVSSPNGREQIGQRGNTPSDPTAQAVRKLEMLDEKIADRTQIISERLVRIEEWLDTIPDTEAHIKAAIRWHYLLGLDWGKTNVKIYGYHSYHVIRKAVMRYLGVEK